MTGGNPGVYKDAKIKQEGDKTRRNVIVIQETAGVLVGQHIPIFSDEIYIEKVKLVGANKAATSAASFSPSLWIGTVEQTLPSLATTVSAAVATGSTAIGTTCSEYMKVKFPATTYFTDSRSILIQYLEQ